LIQEAVETEQKLAIFIHDLNSRLRNKLQRFLVACVFKNWLEFPTCLLLYVNDRIWNLL